jgi:SAM-dependent methyltransferase
MHISTTRNILNLPLSIFYFVISILLVFINLMIPRKKYVRIQKKSSANETQNRLSDVVDYIKPDDKVLDVGCGNGQFGESIAKKFQADVAGVDVVDYAKAGIPINLYDGQKLPFADDSFDVIIMAFMLHHVQHQDKLFEEAVRCSRRNIIIFEDTYFSPWQKVFTVWNDIHSNFLVGFVKIVKGVENKGILKIPMPFTFRSVDGWHDLFEDNNLIVQATKVRHAKYKPHSKVTFALKKYE